MNARINRKLHLSTYFLLSTLTAASTYAAQIPTDPGDYRPLPAGTDLGILYSQNTRWDDFYSNGNKAAVDLELTTHIGLARWVHYVELGGVLLTPQVILPFGKVELDTPNGSTDSTGIGDPMIGGSAWLYDNQETKTHFALTAMISLPLGKYDADQASVNIGENRWKAVFQAAFVKQLSDSFSVESVLEFTTFGDNDDFVGLNREQDDQYALQIHLNKHISQTTTLSLSYYHDFAGETTLANQAQNDELDNNSWQATFSKFIGADKQIIAEYGTSIDTENGFAEKNRFNFRFVKVF